MTSFDIEIGRSGASRYHKCLSLDLEVERVFLVELWQLTCLQVVVDNLWLFSTNQSLLVLEGCQAVQIVHVLSSIDFGHIAKVHRFYVHLNLLLQLLPIEGHRHFFLFLSSIDA